MAKFTAHKTLQNITPKFLKNAFTADMMKRFMPNSQTDAKEEKKVDEGRIDESFKSPKTEGNIELTKEKSNVWGFNIKNTEIK